MFLFNEFQSATLESELRGGLDALAERFGPNCEERRAVKIMMMLK